MRIGPKYLDESEARAEQKAEERLRHLFRQFNRTIERDLKKERPRLFRALEEFANIRSDKEAWSHFRNRWPRFFPATEYERADKCPRGSVRDYRKWLLKVWDGNSAALLPLLGIKAETPFPDEPRKVSGIRRIPAQFFLDWDEGVFRYRGMCMFHRALYLLFRESWRARTCEQCTNKFIARKVAQRYCGTDCSEKAQRKLKLKWWDEHGEKWRQGRKDKSQAKGEKSGTRKTR